MSDYLDINNEKLLKDFFSETEQQVKILEDGLTVGCLDDQSVPGLSGAQPVSLQYRRAEEIILQVHVHVLSVDLDQLLPGRKTQGAAQLFPVGAHGFFVVAHFQKHVGLGEPALTFAASTSDENAVALRLNRITKKTPFAPRIRNQG